MPESLYLISTEDEREWSRWLDPVPHDFYHTAAYHRFSEQSGEGRAWLGVYGSAERYLLWPYLERRLGEFSDITSVYGYAGPLALGCAPGDPFLGRARRAIREMWRSQNVISAFTRFHPVLENHRWGDGSLAGGPTVSIDLTASKADNWHDYQPSLRNRIHRGRRLGLATTIDDSWKDLNEFVRLYRATMTRNCALPGYFFSPDYFRRLRQTLGPHAVLMLTRLDGRVAAAGIFVEYRGIVQNHFCVNDESFIRLGPSKVLLDDVRRWAHARGNRVFHLGGGRGATPDSLFAFKAGFSRRRHVFYTGRWVLNAATYSALCQGLPHDAHGFFPAYRSPLAPPEALSA